MATLTNKTIASSYPQLLSLPDGGGNETTLVAITDGDGVNTFALQLATDKVYVNGSLGIGVTDPATPLEIAGSGAEAELIYLTSTQSANTSNRVRLSHRLLTDSQERTSFSLLSGFNTITDGSRNSIVEFKTSNAGTFGTAMTINGGNVGIGTSSPSVMLNLESATSTAITAENTGNSAVTLNLDANRSGADQGLGNINFKWNGTAVAQISGASGADTTNKDDGQIQFSTMSGGSSSVNMTLDKDGKLGIGTASPDTNLHISGSGAKEIRMQSSDSGSRLRLEGATQADIVLKDTAGGSNTKIMQQVIMDDVFKFRTLTDAGNIGIDPVLQMDLATADISVGSATAPAYIHSQNVPNHVANTMSSPYYRFDGVDDVITVTEATQTPHLELGTGDFSFEMLVKAEEWTSLNYIFGKFEDGNNYYALNTDSNDFLNFYAIDGGSAKINLVATATGGLTDGQWAHIAVVADRSGSGQFYVNGTAIGTTTSVMSTDAVEQNADFTFARLDTNYGEMEMSNLKYFNKALTATEVKEMYSGMSVPFKYKGANQTELLGGTWTNNTSTLAYETFSSSGNNITEFINTSQYGWASNALSSTLIIGKRYRLTYNMTLDSGTAPNFWVGTSASGAAQQISTTVTGSLQTAEFTATAAGTHLIQRNGIEASDGSVTSLSLVPIGAVAEYMGSSAGEKVWGDSSGNDLHGTVSGATLENTPYDSSTEYEEGSWTPVFPANTLTGTLNGNYTRIGNIVHVQGFLASLDYDGSGSTAITISGLPYDNKSGLDVYVTFQQYNVNVQGSNNTGNIIGLLSNDSSVIHLQDEVDNGIWVTTKEDAFSTSSQSYLSFQISYQVA
jgi:hypothetical protein